MHLVIVDDEPEIVRLLARLAARDGHTAATFTASLEALDYIGANRVDLLLTDIVMPPPDGLQLVREARSLRPHLVSVVVTGYASKYSVQEILAAGASDLIFKPVRAEELRARIAFADERRRAVQTFETRHRDLQMMSADMIRGLERELASARVRGRTG